ncbi:2Fe-2S iron-sulfur cluster-binding protein [Nannocystis punicea]|uniref:2Fe-2S iron-sulfur cluster-binding protein n=1 Tax=Nannocystis punicea TaxID=2995304 RepID=A0ABY7GWS8_9BACT|nr:2Fe-2S iron-sulfur cluster-binding protein [Nannocystis poenicansa]WAS91440.1 2Fe-2S iron-sulfur cluster-binding protein [Nannocystis poenicansa]
MFLVMHRLTSVAEVEAVVGRPIPAVTMKQIDTLDEGCRLVLARSPIAGFGWRDEQGAPCSDFVGGRPGFVRVDSATRITVEVGENVQPRPGSGVSFVFLLPGVGETLRLNGSVDGRSRGRLSIHVEEGFVHCPKCILRSGLWKPSRGSHREHGIAAFLAASPFAVISSWDGSGASDTSPRGDPAGFIRLLDACTLAIPDRKGNQRADTFHNLLTCDRISLAAVVPGRHDVLHVRGTAYITDEPGLLSTMALKGKEPHLALCVRIEHAALVANAALREARVWQPSSHVNRAEVPDLMALAARHLARNQDRGAKAMLFRSLGRLLGAFPAPIRRLLDIGFRKDLAKEGYEEVETRPGLGTRKVRVVAVRRETPEAVTLLLEDGAPFHFRAGQYFTLCLDIDGEKVRRAYSASSMPGEPRLALTIKRVAGGRCSSHVHERVRAGDSIELIGPSGSFAIEHRPTASRELVLIAGGSGITPIASIAQTVLAHEPSSRIALLYGNRSRPDVIFAVTLERLRSEHGARFRLRHVLEQPPEDWSEGTGVLDEATLRVELERLGPSPDAHFFVCGPEPMMKAARRAFEALAVQPHRIHEERFSPPRRSPNRRAADRRLPLLVEQAGQRIGATEVPAGKTLLEAGLDAGLPLPFSCAMGNCGECRVKLTAGEVEMDEPNSLTQAERDRGYVLACVARPLSPTTIEIEEEAE